MLLWKLFGSERKVQEALDKSVGYDISPTNIQMPANTDTAPASSRRVKSLEIDKGDNTPEKKKA